MASSSSSEEEEEEEESEIEEEEEKEKEVAEDDDDDEAPAEMANADTDEFEIGQEDKTKRRKRRIRNKNLEVPEDDVLERATQARLKRETELAHKITEFSDEGGGEDDNDEEEVPSSTIDNRITVAVITKDRVKRAKAGDGAFNFAKTQLNGGNRIKRVPLSKIQSQRVKGPALEFVKQKN